jgi:HK97 family phage major capsid protein
MAADFIEVLRNASATAQLGAQYLTGLVGKVDIPRQATATQTYWVGESSPVTDAEATTDKVSLSPKTLGALSTISRLMVLQSTPSIEMMVRRDLVRVLALGIDLAVLNGTGASNQPLGIANQSGVGSIVGGTNGANISFDFLIQMIAATKIANAPQENLGFAFNAKVNGYLQTLKATTNQYLWSPAGYFGGAGVAPMPTVQGQRVAVSNQLPYNLTKGTSSGICSQLIYGNWEEVLVGCWGSLELLLNPYDTASFANGDVKIRALQTVDVAVRHAASFAVMSDALTPGF